MAKQSRVRVKSRVRVGREDCNTVMEGFFGTLKFELNLRISIGTREITKGIVFEWVEVFYNRVRPHSSNDSLPFKEFWSRS